MNTNKIIGQQMLISALSPVLGLIIAFKSSSEKFIVFTGTLFMGLVGSTFIYLPGTDGHSHLRAVEQFYMDMSFGQFLTDAWSLLLLRPVEGSSDMYKHILSYLAGGVFGIPELLHVFGGLILGYFYTRSVLIVLENKPKHKNTLLLLSFIALFLIIRSVSALNSIRMWTAMWVFFYGAYAYITRGNLKYLGVVFLAIFIHFSYLLYAIPLLLAVVLKKRKLLIAAMFLISFFVNIDFERADSLVRATGLYEAKAKVNVIDEEELERRAQETATIESKSNFYKEWGPLIYSRFSIIFLSFVLLFLYLRRIRHTHIEFLIAGGLLLLMLSNLSSLFSPSVSGRGVSIAASFLTAAVIQILSLSETLRLGKITRKFTNFSFAAFFISAIPYLLFHISYAINSASIFIFGLPALSWIGGEDDLSIRDFLALMFNIN